MGKTKKNKQSIQQRLYGTRNFLKKKKKQFLQTRKKYFNDDSIMNRRRLELIIYSRIFDIAMLLLQCIRTNCQLLHICICVSFDDISAKIYSKDSRFSTFFCFVFKNNVHVYLNKKNIFKIR